jgi:hypothetical protein
MNMGEAGVVVSKDWVVMRYESEQTPNTLYPESGT